MINKTSRRDFLQTSAALITASLGASAFVFKKKTPRLAFSTLGCPDWSLKQIVDFAAQHGFKGIEVRGILRQMDLPQCKEFSEQNIASSLRMMQDNGLQFVNLGSSATMHFAEANERKKNLDDGKRYIDLAKKLECPYIRVFPNNFPKDQERNQTMDLIAKGLLELGNHAKGSNVIVLIESHGDLIYIEDLQSVMKASEHEHVGLVWDTVNMWTKTKESPTLTYDRLKKYIRHTHIKNAKVENETITYTRLAQGDVPIFEAIDVLSKGGYKGYYSFEWEKLWHPELEAPELAIADYAVVMKKHFQK
ncbi:MAG: sugar phosphate isomerase/epimerase family protein [Cyclobacteriaceae bacterium]